MSRHEKIDYVEFQVGDVEATKRFFATAFSWTFTDYPQYVSFHGAGIDGGFYQSPHRSDADKGGTLLVFYSEDLEATMQKITDAGGRVVKPTFSFPGGRRFHFADPSGNEFAVHGAPEPA